jgi:hypothetical protein
MALIADNHPALSGDPKQFWKDELGNSRIILYELDKAIHALTKKEIRQYTINTGQDAQTVTRQDLPGLYDRREKLLKQIQELEIMTGEREADAGMLQVVPEW